MATALAADFGSFTVAGQSTAPRLFAEYGAFVLSGQEAVLGRQFIVELGDLTLKLDRLQSNTIYFDGQGRPTVQGQRYFQRHCEAIETAFSSLRTAVQSIQAAYEAAAQAQQAATEANNSVATVQETAAQAQQLVTDLQNGSLNLDAVTIGGAKFVNNDGFLEREPSLL